MKIVVISPEMKHPIRLLFPTSFLKSRLMWKLIANKTKDLSIDYKQARLISQLVYRDLRKYIRRNGHFDVVNITSTSGEKVIIRV